MASQDDIFAYGATKLVVGPGATLALLVTGIAGEVGGILKYFSGGSLEIIGVTTGQSLTAAQMVTALGTGYLLGTTEIVNTDGNARYYLMALGATSIAYSLKGLSSGN